MQLEAQLNFYTKETTDKMTLESAPQHVKMAVDLIYLLESNEIDPEAVLEALKIVENDFKDKVAQRNKQQ